MELYILILVITIALIFEYINGFHDSANAIATVVSTKVLSPRNAIIYGAVLNFAGAFSGTHVAKTIGSGIVSADAVSQTVIICALIGAIVWNLFTWYYGIPSSSSHALIGGLIGATVAKAGGTDIVNIQGTLEKVIIPMFTSPLIGFIFGILFMCLLLNLCRKAIPDRVNKYFKKLQLVSSGVMAFSHGSNDAQKTMGIITLALLTQGTIKSMEVPFWVIALCALFMGLGTLAGGWRIIKTMGSKVIKLHPIDGFAAETSAASVILTASHFGIPISTTHVISTSIMGVGTTKRASAVRWGIVKSMVTAWIFTIPICALIAWLAYFVVSQII